MVPLDAASAENAAGGTGRCQCRCMLPVPQCCQCRCKLSVPAMVPEHGGASGFGRAASAGSSFSTGSATRARWCFLFWKCWECYCMLRMGVVVL